MIELHDVTKNFDHTLALDRLSITFPRGTSSAIIGPSGCGKSTLLRTVVGLVTTDTGTIKIDGTALTTHGIRALRQRIGYVIQEGGLFPHLTTQANITLVAKLRGWSPDRIASRIYELGAMTNFPKNALERFPSELSGGQRQRACLMRALVMDPEVLLLDEPLGSLDPMIRSELQDELREIFRSLDKTVVMVTHDIAEGAYVCDRLVLMKDGRIHQQGSLAELSNRPISPFVKAFLNAQRREGFLSAAESQPK